jgi:hypothetical protein
MKQESVYRHQNRSHTNKPSDIENKADKENEYQQVMQSDQYIPFPNSFHTRIVKYILICAISARCDLLQIEVLAVIPLYPEQSASGRTFNRNRYYLLFLTGFLKKIPLTA